MLRPTFIVAGTALLVLILFVAISIFLLLRSVGSYRTYWQERASQKGELVYVALGDSAAQGIGASRPERGYVGLLADSIHATSGRPVKVINLSVTGATVQDVLAKQIPELRQLRQDVDIVTLDIGANDVVHKISPQDFARDYEAILQALPAGRSIIGDVPYFGGRLRDDAGVRQANAVLRPLASKYSVPIAPLYDQLKPRQSPLIYAIDLFHPSDRGYRIWHDAYWSQLRPVVEDLTKERTI